MSGTLSLPPAFEERMACQLGDDYPAFVESLSSATARTLRLHPIKASTYTIPDATRIVWHSFGMRLPEEKSVTWDPLFHAGVYYVQEASSMFLAALFQSIQPTLEAAVILDLCAAPGGKSTLLAEIIQPEDLLISNEVIRSRAPILDENLQKWGYPNVCVTSMDPKDVGEYLQDTVDVVVVDAPCSGEGMFRKDPAAILEWSTANGALCAGRQKRILHDVWDSLKPGGYLIYSTCTFNPEENEEIVQWMHESFGVEAPECTVNIPDGVVTQSVAGIPTYAFLPHRIAGEGFFITLVRKPDTMNAIRSTVHSKSKKKTSTSTPSTPLPEPLHQWMERKGYKVQTTKEGCTAYPEAWSYVIEKLPTNKTVRCGLPIGTMKGKDWMPAHAWALYIEADSIHYPTYELTYTDAIRYLRKEEITAPEEKGWHIVTYLGHALGFIKSMGNRCNNYYPSEWRIRHAIPEYSTLFLLEKV